MNQTVCDACGKSYSGPYFPTGWYRVEYSTYGGEVCHDLCSLACLGVWAKREQEQS